MKNKVIKEYKKKFDEILPIPVYSPTADTATGLMVESQAHEAIIGMRNNLEQFIFEDFAKALRDEVVDEVNSKWIDYINGEDSLPWEEDVKDFAKQLKALQDIKQELTK